VPSYRRPTALEDALAELSSHPHTVIAGGTDFYPARVGRAIDENVLDISGIPDLAAISSDEDGWRIPALATWTDLLAAPLPPLFDGLMRAARTVGGRQVQNRGTVCGNLCNASPAADGIPNLLALDAGVELASVGGIRRVPVADFVLGNRQTVRRSDELVTAVLVPRPADDAAGSFLKLGSRAYLVISIVMVAGVIERSGTRIARARIAVGACSPVARRLPQLEAALEGQQGSRDLAALVASEHLAPLAPIDDVRAGAAYREAAALVLVRRLVSELAA
jgi:CO/xanthine dehydrogenase FAD-binding subunit